MERKIVAKHADDTKAFAKTFFDELIARGPSTNATVVALSGELGAGKTFFTKEVARLFGVTRPVQSPTFVLERIYKLDSGKYNFKHLIHIDAYRLEGGAELATLGWHDLLVNPGNLIFIEWPEKVADVMPDNMLSISIEHLGEETREIRW